MPPDAPPAPAPPSPRGGKRRVLTCVRITNGEAGAEPTGAAEPSPASWGPGAGAETRLSRDGARAASCCGQKRRWKLVRRKQTSKNIYRRVSSYLKLICPLCSAKPAAKNKLDVIGRRESCASGQIPMTILSCFSYILEEWTVEEYLKKYLFHVIIALLTIAAILVFFIVPLTILFFLYLTNIFLLIYQRNSEVKADPLSEVWDGARKSIASFWDVYARIWHGYELHGVKNLPEGPGILVYYHGAIPVDYLYFLSRLFLWKKRLCLSVADNFVFRLAGLKLLLEVTGIMRGTREECLIALKNGHLVSISPGGVREALFSDESYQLMWGNRKGFAQLALEAKVPIIPMYTQNVREGYRMFKERKLFRQLYESTRLPLTPPYGGLPVKFRTYIGEPIPYDPNVTTEELVEKTKAAVQALISKHQTIPGSIWKALLERFDKRKSD